MAPVRDIPASVATALRKESQQVEAERSRCELLGCTAGVAVVGP